MVLFWFPRKRLLSLLCGVLAIFVVFYLTIYQIAPIMADARKIQEPVCRVDTAEKQVALSFDVEWMDVQTGAPHSQEVPGQSDLFCRGALGGNAPRIRPSDCHGGL